METWNKKHIFLTPKETQNLALQSGHDTFSLRVKRDLYKVMRRYQKSSLRTWRNSLALQTLPLFRVLTNLEPKEMISINHSIEVWQ